MDRISRIVRAIKKFFRRGVRKIWISDVLVNMSPEGGAMISVRTESGEELMLETNDRLTAEILYKSAEYAYIEFQRYYEIKASKVKSLTLIADKNSYDHARLEQNDDIRFMGKAIERTA